MNRLYKLNEMLAASPNDCFLLHALGLEYLKTGEMENALAAFKKVIESDSNYVGTYYHLAKTLEKVQLQQEAIKIYEQGIEIATKLKDNHARNELQMALDDLIE